MQIIGKANSGFIVTSSEQELSRLIGHAYLITAMRAVLQTLTHLEAVEQDEGDTP